MTTNIVQQEDAGSRREQAYKIRVDAATIAHDREHPAHYSNGDEHGFILPSGDPSYIAAFTKGLRHDTTTGLIKRSNHFEEFVAVVNDPTPENIANLRLGPPKNVGFLSGIAKDADVRGWESMGAGTTFDLQGPDSHAVTMPPVPRLLSPELHLEMAEVYWMALLRDVSLSYFSESGRTVIEGDVQHKCRQNIADIPELIETAIQCMNNMPWVRDEIPDLSPEESARKRPSFNIQSVFRGFTPGDNVGPYLSQFLIMGTRGLGKINELKDGFVQYGAIRIDQRVRVATPGKDYMTNWASFIDVQNAADLRRMETFETDIPFRFISTPRDLATYVHYDALYQAYLNACIIMLSLEVPYDDGIPFIKRDKKDKQEGFAQWGGPHILTLVTEVATRALKAVRFQKFNIHRRLRPEAVAGILDRYTNAGERGIFEEIGQPLADALGEDLINRIIEENKYQNENIEDEGIPRAEDLSIEECNEYSLLPMAFAEGSPMHPSYGSGHATVAGACVTILKAFFKTDHTLPCAYVVNEDGSTLVDVKEECGDLTVEGELNKLCSNISVGRNWAGVHYFSDYFESMLLGERIAIGLLEEQALQYKEDFSMTIPLFDGENTHVITNKA